MVDQVQRGLARGQQCIAVGEALEDYDGGSNEAYGGQWPVLPTTKSEVDRGLQSLERILPCTT